MRIKKNGQIITLTESDLKKITKKVLSEDDRNEDEYDIPFKEKMDNILFGSDEHNIFSSSGDFGYLSQENRLSKKISPIQRKKRIKKMISKLEDHLEYLKTRVGEEDTWINDPKYSSVWGEK